MLGGWHKNDTFDLQSTWERCVYNYRCRYTVWGRRTEGVADTTRRWGVINAGRYSWKVGVRGWKTFSGFARRQWWDWVCCSEICPPDKWGLCCVKIAQKSSHGAGTVPHKRTLCLRKIAARNRGTIAEMLLFFPVTSHRGLHLLLHQRKVFWSWFWSWFWRRFLHCQALISLDIWISQPCCGHSGDWRTSHGKWWWTHIR